MNTPRASLLSAIEFVLRHIRHKRKEGIAWIEPDALQRHLAAGADLAILDVRGPDEFSGELGHIPGAFFAAVLADRLLKFRERWARRSIPALRVGTAHQF